MSLKNVRVSYRVDATVNLTNFENVKPGITLESDVLDGEVTIEEVKNVIKELSDLGDSFITHQYNEAKQSGIG